MRAVAEVIEWAGMGVVAGRLAAVTEWRELTGKPKWKWTPNCREFVFPAVGVVPRIGISTLGVRRGVEVERWTFPSPLPSGIPRNDSVTVWRYGAADHRTLGARFDDPPRSVILLHGWLAWQRSYFLAFCADLARRGVTAYLLELPLHLSRTPPGALSGELAFGSGLDLGRSFVHQAVAETRGLAAALGARGEAPPVLAGISLGGWIAALAADTGLPHRGVVLAVPILDPVETLWHSPMLGLVRRAIERRARRETTTVSESSQRAAYADLMPLERRGDLARPGGAARVHILASRWDRVAPSRVLERARESWPQAHIEVEPQGHFSALLSPHFRRRVVDLAAELATNGSHVRVPAA